MENIIEFIHYNFNTIIIITVCIVVVMGILYFINNGLDLSIKKKKKNDPLIEVDIYKNTSPLKCEDDSCRVKDSDLEADEPDNIIREKEVFNISKNIYTYHDAKTICKALDSKLATFEQVQDAYKKGADWCNYGWSKGQMALYPTQKSTWKKLQKSPKQFRNECGHPGINGGHFNNPYLKFGVNCYGYKPEIKDSDRRLLKYSPSPRISREEKERRRKIRVYRSLRERNKIPILPFKKDSWNNSNNSDSTNIENVNIDSQNTLTNLKNINNKKQQLFDKTVDTIYDSNNAMIDNISDGLNGINDVTIGTVNKISDSIKPTNNENESGNDNSIFSIPNTIGMKFKKIFGNFI